MPFLSRRSVEPLTPSPPLRDARFGYSLKQSEVTQTSRSRALSEASLLRRVSTLFSVRRRTSRKKSASKAKPSPAGIGYNHTFPRHTLPRLSSDSTPQSSLEIRRPSGLGRRASILESNDSVAESESFGSEIQVDEATAPTGYASLPNLLGGAFHFPEGSFHQLGLAPVQSAVSNTLSEPIFRTVLEFLPRHDLAVVALASRGFCAAARRALYHALDVETVIESSLEKLFNVLAYRRELAALVVSFRCPSWPTWELAAPDGRVCSVPSDDVRHTFQNMHNLKSLTIPSFAIILSYTPSLTFSLTYLTLLDKKLTQSQLASLRGWLVSQPSLESLSFPHLIEYTMNDPSLVDEWGRIADPWQISGHDPFLTMLPGLKSLRASTEIVGTLCFSITNPIEHLTLDVHETLYTGLRPSSVIRSLTGVREMHIIFAPEVDRRTVEKFLGVTGAMLTGEDNAEAMKSLEVEVLWTDRDAAETLYGIVTSIISRFRGLETLKLTSPFRSIQAPIPAPVNLSLPPPSPAPSSTLTGSSSVPSSICAATLRGGTIRKEFVACGVEKNYAKTWTQHCPSLSDIQFDFSCSTTDADVELCGVWFRRRIPLL